MPDRRGDVWKTRAKFDAPQLFREAGRIDGRARYADALRDEEREAFESGLLLSGLRYVEYKAGQIALSDRGFGTSSDLSFPVDGWDLPDTSVVIIDVAVGPTRPGDEYPSGLLVRVWSELMQQCFPEWARADDPYVAEWIPHRDGTFVYTLDPMRLLHWGGVGTPFGPKWNPTGERWEVT